MWVGNPRRVVRLSVFFPSGLDVLAGNLLRGVSLDGAGGGGSAHAVPVVPARQSALLALVRVGLRDAWRSRLSQSTRGPAARHDAVLQSRRLTYYIAVAVEQELHGGWHDGRLLTRCTAQSTRRLPERPSVNLARAASV